MYTNTDIASDLEKPDTIAIKNKLESQQLFKVSPFKEVIWRTWPHRHGAYFEIIYLSEGAFYRIDSQKFQINPVPSDSTILLNLQAIPLHGNRAGDEIKFPNHP